MIPSKTIEELIEKHSALEKELSSGEIDKKLFAEKSKEYSDINEIIDVAKKYISFENDKKELEKILNDQTSDDELKKMAETELNELKSQFGENITTLLSDEIKLEEYVTQCDLLIGGVLIPGANAPKLVSKEMIKEMKRGSVVVDVAIDQGGCVETSKPTTHADPTYIIDDVVHYCVANMPGGVPMTSTLALNAATLPFVLKLAKEGYKNALASDANFLAGLNVCLGNVTYKAVADDLGLEFVDPSKAIN